MKKIFFAITLLLPLLALAQNKTTFGINAGVTLANIKDGDETSDNGVDFLLGLSLDVPINENFSILTNVNYERKSSKETVYNYFESKDVEAKVRMHYISVPVNLKYYIGTKKNFFVHAGPYAAFFVDDTFFADGEEITSEYAGDSDFKSLDFGITSGIGTRIPVGKENAITLGVRYNLGLSNVSDMPDYTIKTRAFNFIFTIENIL